MVQVCKTQDAVLRADDPVISGRRKTVLRKGDTVYWFLPRVEPGQASKLQRKWMGPFTVRRVVSNSLLIIYPDGNWAKHPREIATITSRVRKVDPAWMDPDNPTRRYVIDLSDITLEDEELREDTLSEELRQGGSQGREGQNPEEPRMNHQPESAMEQEPEETSSREPDLGKITEPGIRGSKKI
jgi:hypothetical protein